MLKRKSVLTRVFYSQVEPQASQRKGERAPKSLECLYLKECLQCVVQLMSVLSRIFLRFEKLGLFSKLSRHVNMLVFDASKRVEIKVFSFTTRQKRAGQAGSDLFNAAQICPVWL